LWRVYASLNLGACYILADCDMPCRYRPACAIATATAADVLPAPCIANPSFNPRYRLSCWTRTSQQMGCTLFGQVSGFHDTRVLACFRTLIWTRMLADHLLYQEASRHCLRYRYTADVVCIGHLHAAACVSINLCPGNIHHVEVGVG